MAIEPDSNASDSPTALIDQTSNDRPLIWPVPLVTGLAVACVAVPWLRLHAVASIYEAVGVALTFLGLAAISARLDRATDDSTSAAPAKIPPMAAGRTVRSRGRLAGVWTRITGSPVPAVPNPVSAEANLSPAGDVMAVGQRQRVDRNTIAARDWLAYLDDRLESVVEAMDAAEKLRSEERTEFAHRLGVHRDQLRAEIVREVRRGWQLVGWGLAYTFLGAVLSAFA